jgi:BirA family biotin operon repressor/biotin-[acetyl-CoA-carboxylase] ligase
MNLDLQKIEAAVKSHPRVRERVREVLLFDQVDSTNQLALQMGSAGLPGGVLIIAETQNKGKGRFNREWVSPRGVNLYLSLLLRPHQPSYDFPLFSLATATALAQAIRSATGLAAGVKWPNDILLEDKKVAGILLEAGKTSGEAPYLVVGIGVNVNWDICDIPKELQATSLAVALGHTVDRTGFINDILIALAEQYQLLDVGMGKKDQLIHNLSEVCVTLGKPVRVKTPNQTFEGIAETILEDGGLLLRLGDGSRRKVLLGDVTHLRTLTPLKRRGVGSWTKGE